MNLRFFCLISLLSLLLARHAIAQPDPNAEQLKEIAMQSTLAYELITSLTTEIGPRLAGSPNDMKAVMWAENKLNALGFDKVYKQAVPVRNWQQKSATATVDSPFKHTLNIVALGGSISTPKEGLTGEVILFKSLGELVDANVEQVQNKIVFISVKLPKDRVGDAYTSLVNIRTKSAIIAARLGAKALVIRSIGTSNTNFPHSGAMFYAKNTPKIPAAALSNTDADQLERILMYGDSVNMSLNIQTSENKWLNSYNVVGEITGTESPDEFIVLAAHLDSWDQGTGAIDNAVGVGIVTASAHIIKNFAQPQRSIRVILFANEEFGSRGAKLYVEKNKSNLQNIIVAAESDFGAGTIWRFDTRFSDAKIKNADIIYDYLLPLNIQRGHNQAYGGPDIIHLADAGVPVVSLVQDGTDYFDFHHTANDTLDKIDIANVKQNVAAYSLFIFSVANSDMVFR
ncbi:M28 family peptidase [Algibacillus agarilyticus]|uniref:M28 family peptidase n=1 Tax=Algibacillus agarilyticus TaxID=2234133 RepID=UPI000DCFCF8F|nr:M28 family peptidase [Algibacillus agarilyticus]